MAFFCCDSVILQEPSSIIQTTKSIVLKGGGKRSEGKDNADGKGGVPHFRRVLSKRVKK